VLHGYSDSVQAPRYLVSVAIEFSAGVQFGHHNLGGRASELVIFLDTGWNSAAVINHGNGVVGVNSDEDFITVARKRFVDRIVDDLKDHVVQPGTVGRIPNVHSGALANGFQPLQYFDAVGAVFARVR
jgi:hypothetical protein